MNKLFISIAFIALLTASTAFADTKLCPNGSSEYCINVEVSNSQVPANNKSDLCYVLQLNGSDQIASGSIPMQELPTVLFAISKDHSAIGKPLSFKIVKAQVVPSGQCNAKQATLQTVSGCDIFEYATIPGVARSMVLKESQAHNGYTCTVAM